MNGVTHLAGGIIAGCLLMKFTGSTEPVLPVLMTSGIAALLPDIDHPYSTVQKYLPLIGKGISRILPERGISHSLFFLFLISFFLLCFSVREFYILAFLTGYLSHLILDTFTPMGVPWLWPCKHYFSIPLIRTSGIIEKFFVSPLSVVMAVYSVWRM